MRWRTCRSAPRTPAWIDGWHPTDEYGNQLNIFSVLAGESATNNQSNVPGGGIGYGWLGAKERAMDNSGVVLMGARLYNPMTGAFTSVDPVFGGNTTAYAYPQDPINMVDLDGLKRRFWPKKSFWKKTITVVAVGTCVVASAGTCAVAGLGAAGLNYGMDRKKKNAKKDLAKDVAITLVSGGAGHLIGKPLKHLPRLHGAKLATNGGNTAISSGAGKCAKARNKKSCR